MKLKFENASLAGMGIVFGGLMGNAIVDSQEKLQEIRTDLERITELAQTAKIVLDDSIVQIFEGLRARGIENLSPEEQQCLADYEHFVMAQAINLAATDVHVSEIQDRIADCLVLAIDPE